jgi:hypothetical protein
MEARRVLLALCLGLLLNFTLVQAQAASSTTAPVATTSVATSIHSTNRSGTTTTDALGITESTSPDVYLKVPNLIVGRIELDVENLKVDINLNAAVAGLISINADVVVFIQKVNLTMIDVAVELELIVCLDNLV